MKFDINLLKYQHQSLISPYKETLLLGGIGSGKSYTGAHFILNNAVNYPGIKQMIVANTYTQLMNASVSALIDLLDELGIEYVKALSGARKRIEFLGSKVYLYSLEKYDSIRGIEVGAIWGDEIGFSKLEAIQVVKGRLRAKIGPKKILWTTSPNGFNWLYDKFEGKDVNPGKLVKLIRARTALNYFLPEGYYTELLDEYGGYKSPLARQELFGEFVNLQAGAIYWAFERGINVLDNKLNPQYPVYVGIDFNIDQMNFVYTQYIGGVLKVVQENSLTHRNANTFDAAKKIVDDLVGKYIVHVVPDSTGKARKSSSASGLSDIQILKDHGLDVVRTRNPLIKDRQNSVNRMFRSKQLDINPECTGLIKEIETLSSREKEGDVSHLAVCLGYVVFKLNPLKRIRQRKHTKSIIV